jgi:L-iditol 2-dehydrogenase
MLAMRLYGKEDLKLVDHPKPKTKQFNAVLRVRATTICATDVKAYVTGTRTKIPVTLGHEFAGDIIEASGQLESYVGKRVIVNPDVFDGRCEYCLAGEHVFCPNRYAIGFDVDGSFAEYVEIPGQAFQVGGVLEIPDDLSYEEASLIEPLSACVRGQSKLNIRLGDIVTIFGCGPIGLMHFLLAKNSGASKVIMIGTNDKRIEMAKRLGVEYIINPAREDVDKTIHRLTSGRGSDVVIVAVGSAQAQRDALRIVRKGGRINFFAGLVTPPEEVPINTNLIHYKQLTVTGTSMHTPAEFAKALDLVSSGIIKLKPLITHSFSLREGLEAFNLSLRGEGLKVAIIP